MAGSRAWSATDRTDGRVDELFDMVRARFPDAQIQRLVGTLPADDDNVYWVTRLGVQVQVDTHEHGRLPLLIQHDSSPMVTADSVRLAWLHMDHLLSHGATDLGLERVQALLEMSAKGDPPPWRAWVEGRDGMSGDSFIMTGPDGARGSPGSRGPDIYVSCDGIPADAATLDLIAEARTCLPLLAQEVLRWRSASHRTPSARAETGSELPRLDVKVDYGVRAGYLVRIDVERGDGKWEDVLLTIDEARRFSEALGATVAQAEAERAKLGHHEE